MSIYGYCRISSNRQNIDRQIRNIKNLYPNAIIIEEVYTGTKFQQRKKLQQLLEIIKEGDSIVFDSVSRMSRNADDGIELYMDLLDKGIELVFIKEPHINTATYKDALKNNIQMTNTDVDFILEGVNKYLMALAKTQIRLAFEQSEKEVMDLRQRTKEGLVTAKLNGKQIGSVKGAKYSTKKSIEKKELILKYSKDFNGSLNDIDVIKLIGIAKNTYYKYKSELRCESNNN